MRAEVPGLVSGAAGLRVHAQPEDGLPTGGPTRVARAILAALGMALAVAGAGCASSSGAAGAAAPSSVAAGTDSPRSTSAPTSTPPLAPLSWSSVAAPAPPAGAVISLDAVTCVSGEDCWAVGSTDTPGPLAGAGSFEPAIERYSGGGWSIVPSPTPPGGGTLFAVACAGAEDCWAVGGAGGSDVSLIEHETGGRWSIVASPTAPAGGDIVLRGVACAGAGDCWAVGSEGRDLATGYPGQDPLVVHNTGDGWTGVSSLRLPAGVTTGELLGVTCVTVGDCWAVGDDGDSDVEPVDPLVERYDGSGWSMVDSPTPPSNEGIVLNAVACPGASDCWAVGQDTVATGGLPGVPAPLIEQDAGSGWSIVPGPALPAGAGTDGTLDGVACAGAGDCWAVGSFDLVGAASQAPAAIEETSGGAWITISTPPVAISTPSASVTMFDELQGVSCPSSGGCWAVGTAQVDGGLGDGGETLILQGR